MKTKIISALTLLSLITLSFPGCGTTGGNPVIVQVNSASYLSDHWYTIIPSAQAAVSDLRLCFKRLRFKKDKSATADDSGSANVDFSPGEVTLSTGGNSLGTVVIPSATYRRIEIDLEPNCPNSSSGLSVRTTNNTGTYSSTQHIQIKFEGTFVADDKTKVLNLDFQNIITAMDSVTNSSQIKNKLEDTSTKGRF
jgi:hypothetical protein